MKEKEPADQNLSPQRRILRKIGRVLDHIVYLDTDDPDRGKRIDPDSAYIKPDGMSGIWGNG